MQEGEVVAVGPATVWPPQRNVADGACRVFYIRVLMSSGQIGFQPDRVALIANHKSMRKFSIDAGIVWQVTLTLKPTDSNSAKATTAKWAKVD
ncbi:MAG TPA: hypothetical protein DEF45_25265 [Rhodopirellula sp.]|nr:MAG: hypothetical protein CBD74_11830 [Saprospirales bacterium TMED214]HBV66327.1 hypothetical protein [Rhodopirellula sp.]